MRKNKLLCTCLVIAGLMLSACNKTQTSVSTSGVSTTVSTETSTEVSTGVSTETTTETVNDCNELIKSYVDAIDVEYGYNLAYKLAYDETLGGACGFRTAGSDYEHLAADFLAAEMAKIGLTDVEKIPVTVDKWQFDSASLTIDGTEINIVPASYAETGTSEEGITAEILNLGDGLASDYEGSDVTGKIVLVGVDQRNIEWIDSYIQEAYLHGAAALVSYSVGGYAMYSDDDRNIQDVCCSDILPTVSISRNEAKAIIEAIEDGKNMCTLKVDNTVEDNTGVAYNVVGRIKGKSSDSQIIYAGHYDKYYYGFQDDCCAISMIFSIAKAMIESGYVPENDILVVCHAAEEWGASDCQHDWTTGAWENINTVHPEWASITRAMFNFELPAFRENGQDSAFVATVPEYMSFVESFVNNFGELVDTKTFAAGIDTEAVATSTMEDGISYRFAGVPYFLNGVDFTDENSFAGNKYHTESDNTDTWDAEVFKQNAALFGAMGIVVDMQPAVSLDLTATVNALSDTLNEDYASEAGFDTTEFKALLSTVLTKATELTKAANDLNAAYFEAVANKDAAKIATLYQDAKTVNAKNLAFFKDLQTYFIALESSADVVIRHEGYVNTLDLLAAVSEALDNDLLFAEDEESGALDISWAINTGYAYSSYVFSAENVAMTNAIYGRGDDNMYWGTNRVTAFADVDEAIRLMFADKVSEAAVLINQEYARFIGLYKEALEFELEGLKALSK